jgi:hypothetical protein
MKKQKPNKTIQPTPKSGAADGWRSRIIILFLISDNFSKINYTKSKRPLDFTDRHCKRLQIRLTVAG